MSTIGKLESKFCGQSHLTPLRIWSASVQLGYGIPQAAFEAVIERKSNVIAAGTRQAYSSYN